MEVPFGMKVPSEKTTFSEAIRCIETGSRRIWSDGASELEGAGVWFWGRALKQVGEGVFIPIPVGFSRRLSLMTLSSNFML